MNARLTLGLLLVFMSGCATVRESGGVKLPVAPVTVLSRSTYAGLRTGIDTLLADSLFPPSNVGMKIVSLTRNEVLYELNPDLLFTPASNQKLFTSALALRHLGKDFQLRTQVLADTLSHTLYLKGYGDPLVSSRELDSLAGLIAGGLSRGKPWRIAADASYFDDLSWGEGWSWDDEPASYIMYISPFCLNQNTIKIIVDPASLVGNPPLVSLQPETRYVSVENGATTTLDTPMTVRGEITRRWREKLNSVWVKGEFPQRRGRAKENLSVLRPELYFATVLGEGLERRGIPIAGITADSVRQPAQEIVTLAHRLDSAVTFMNKVSDNLSAEVLLKDVAAETFGPPGNAKAGIALLKQYLGSMGIDTVRMSAVDGSGLSAYNLTSASRLVSLLSVMYADTALFPAFYHSLPIAGKDGTLAGRMRDTPAEGNLRAKTGHVFGVSSLSGYVRTRDGELLAFSILMQKFPNGADSYRAVQNRIGVFLAGTQRKDF
jgi:D-alanyl-D-alanine carboxypeptidase/D-alanyl-D-alanine-endopeptidase (penicillin-binding protein 4)